MARIVLNPTDTHQAPVAIPDYLQMSAPDRMASGIAQLDRDFKGIALARITEVFGSESSGKTRLALHLARQALQAGGNVLYIDADQTLMPQDIPESSQFVLSRLNQADDVFRLIVESIRSKAFSLIITDTLSSLVSPQDTDVQDKSLSQILSDYIVEFEHELQLSPHMGLLFLQRNVFMNGCLHGNTLIPFTNGKVYPIAQVVDKRLRGKVYSLDDSGKIQTNEIQDWHNHGKDDNPSPFMFLCARHENGWQSRVFLTANHPVHTQDRGWVAVSEIREGDTLSGRYMNFLNKGNREFLRGCLLGAAHFHFNREYRRLELFLSGRQGTPLSRDPEYMRFKADKLSCYDFRERNGKDGKYWVSHFAHSDDFYRLRDEKESYNKDKNRRSERISFYENLSDREIALWFGDKGEVRYTEEGWEFSLPLPVKTEEEACAYVLKVKEAGYPVYVWAVLSDNDEVSEYRMAFADETPLRLMMTHLPAEAVRRYFGKAMDYFNITDKGNISHLRLMSPPLVHQGDFTVLTVQKMDEAQIKRNPNRYDLTIKRHANYLAGGLGGIFVHNSPTSPLAMAAHSRIHTASDTDGNLSCRVVKDKDTPPTGESYLFK